MKIAVCCHQSLEERFQRAGESQGHTLLLCDALPDAACLTSEHPDAVLLMVGGCASAIQDFLVSLYALCPQKPQVLLFERRADGRCFYAESRCGDDTLSTLLRAAVGEDCATRLGFPDENWRERFPGLFDEVPRRESMKTILYGVRDEEFEHIRETYRLRLGPSGFYLFVWELEKSALVDYPVNKSIHYYLHMLRMEDFDRLVQEQGGGEVVFSDISFAYILVNAPRSNSVRAQSQQVEKLTYALAGAAGTASTHCFISDLIQQPGGIRSAHQEFKRTCAYRFFCREAAAISNTYIKTHQRWFSAKLVRETIDTIKHYLHFDMANELLPGLIRKLYLEIVKPSMSYALYYLSSEAILESLKEELAVKLLLETIDSPWLVLTTQLGTIEESCERVLECIDTLARRQVKRHNINNLVVRQALQYIEEHYAQRLSVVEISKYLSVSSSYLGQCFKQETGVSIKKYLLIYRMQQAKHLLLTTDAPVSMVAFSVGYDDYRQFSKMFKTLTGVSPVQCRKGAMGKPQDYPREAHFSLNI